MQWLLLSVATLSSLSLILAADSPAAPAPARQTRSFGTSGSHLGGPNLNDLENWRALYAKRAAMLKRGFKSYGSNGLGGADLSDGNLQDWSSVFERGLRAFGRQGAGLGSDGGLGEDGLQNWMAFYQRHARELRKRGL